MLWRTYRPLAIAFVLAAALTAALTSACGGGKSLILATTTSTQDSGLLDVLVPVFEDESGYNVKVVAVGTGEALGMGSRGDADVLLVHAPKSEEEFVSEGNGVNRQLVMHNDFVFAGPADDPAGIADAEDVLGALQAIADADAPFISRGDDSGTNKLELALWEELGFDPGGEGWYEESGQGMGATLQIANQRGAYTISDRGTFLSLSDTLDLDLLFEGDPKLLNIYHVMQVNPEKFDGLEEDGAAAFVAFLVSDRAQGLIGDFGVEQYGQPLFIPDAGKPEDELSVP
ncbi:MAG: substrate-binding domain-containing protein [Chloroflexi bacterium]|nr:substrate-binding domain-containing protein [Chloroflexota bacterium]